MNGASDPPRRDLLVALAGQPNVGKSTIFNLVTGLSQHVGNWAGKTVERREGMAVWRGARLRVVDLPGIDGLSAHSAEERIARDFIIGERPDVVVMVANAAALERNLYLLSELLILPPPVVLGLNMMDVAESESTAVQPAVLEAALALPVVPVVASRNRGVSDLLTAAVALASASGDFRPARPEIAAPHRDVLARLLALVAGAVPPPYPPAWVALKLLEGDREITGLSRGWLPRESWEGVAALLAEHEDAVLDVARGRYEWIGRMVEAAVTRRRCSVRGSSNRPVGASSPSSSRRSYRAARGSPCWRFSPRRSSGAGPTSWRRRK